MHVVAGGNVRRGAADGLCVFHDRFALMDGADSDLVAGIDLGRSCGATGQDMTRFDRDSGNGNIIVLRQQDAGWFRHPMFLPCVRRDRILCFVFYRQ